MREQLQRPPLMKNLRFAIPLFAVPFLAACGASAPATQTKAPDPGPAQTSTTATSTPAPTETPKAVEAPTPTPAPAPASAKAPKTSTFKIEGVSISDVTIAQLSDVFKKRGWEEAQPPQEAYLGKYEQLMVLGRKDKTKKVIVTIIISRVAKEPKPLTPGADENKFAPKTAQAVYADLKVAAQSYDSEADVLVTVMYAKGGDSADAKKFLDGLLTQSKQ
jgi:hypothetical protein